MVLKKLLDDMKAYWKAENLAKRVTQERKLGVTIPGQQRTVHEVSLPKLVYFIYATAKEDLQVRPTQNESNINNIQNTSLLSLVKDVYFATLMSVNRLMWFAEVSLA